MLSKRCFFAVLVLSLVTPGRVESQATTDYSSCCDIADRQLETMENELERLQQSLATERQQIKTLQKQIAEQGTSDSIVRETNVMCTTIRNRPKSVDLIKTLYPSSYARVYGIAKGSGEIYVLGRDSKTIRVFEDCHDFRQLREIQLSDIAIPHDIIYNNKSNCLYIADYENKCIWKMTTTANAQPTRWLQNINHPCTLSVSRDGHVMLLRSGQPISQLELYDLDASLIRRLELPEEISAPNHAIQKSNGNFIIGHREKRQAGSSVEAKAVISQLTSEGEIVNRFYPSEEMYEMSNILYLALSVNEDLLFVADVWKHRVILFDATRLNWTQVLTTTGDSAADRPFRLLYDERKRHLFVGHWAARQVDRQWRDGRVDIYELV